MRRIKTNLTAIRGWSPRGIPSIAKVRLGLTRFGGHPEAFARGAPYAENTPALFA
jgi:hypothetical protein